MACSNPNDTPEAPDSGFATPAAAAICLAMAIIVAAVMSLSVSAMRASRQDFQRAKAQYNLAGARLSAVQSLLQSSNLGRIRWTLASQDGPVEVVAEPEASKLSITAAGDDASSLGQMLSASSPGGVATALQGAANEPAIAIDKISEADPGQTWRLCARSFISPYGAGQVLPSDPPTPPRPGPVNWRLGQLWRLRLTDVRGWTEDSVIRFVGSPSHPIAVAARRFTHSGPLGDRCDFIAQDAPVH